MRLSVQVAALAAAWKISRDVRYAAHAARHLGAWFLDQATLMNPNLQFSQAIHGRATGRSIGVIDTIHLVEVARSVTVLSNSAALPDSEFNGLKKWFGAYLEWMTSSPNGIGEREAKNNHGTCWVMQVAEFARLVVRPDLMEFCRDRFKNFLVPNQIAFDGRFPLELQRTKPYGYCLFNLEAMATICHILSDSEDDLFRFRMPDEKGFAKAMDFMFLFIADKSRWPYPHDVMYFDQWPVRQVSLLFGGLALERPTYIELWRTLNSDPQVGEIIRNYPIRQPVLWVD
jgi:hypothetical protein